MKYLFTLLFCFWLSVIFAQNVTRKIGDNTFAGLSICDVNSYLTIWQGVEKYCAFQNDTVRVYFIDDNYMDFVNTSKDNCTGQFSINLNPLDLSLLKSKTIVAIGWVGLNENKLMIFTYDMNVILRNALEELRCK